MENAGGLVQLWWRHTSILSNSEPLLNILFKKKSKKSFFFCVSYFQYSRWHSKRCTWLPFLSEFSCMVRRGDRMFKKRSRSSSVACEMNLWYFLESRSGVIFVSFLNILHTHTCMHSVRNADRLSLGGSWGGLFGNSTYGFECRTVRLRRDRVRLRGGGCVLFVTAPLRRLQQIQIPNVQPMFFKSTKPLITPRRG